MARSALWLTLGALLLAGCSGDQPAPDGGSPGTQAEDTQAAFTANGTIPEPDWPVGQWWQHEITYAGGGSERFKAIVVANGGPGAVVATDDSGFAKRDAAYDHPLLGTFGPGLSMQGWGGAWDLFNFPLKDGARWTGAMPNIAHDVIASDVVQLGMMATFTDKAPAPGGKQEPGLYIMGHASDADGAMAMEGYFLPSLGWFSEMTFFDLDPDQDPLELTIRVTDAGTNWTGTYRQHTAEPLLTVTDFNGFDDDPTAGGQPVADPHPHSTFTMSGQATTLFGVIWAETVAGTRQVVLQPPQGNAIQVQSTSSELDSDQQGLDVDVPAVAGEWRLATVGAGGWSWMYAELYELVEAEFQL